MENILENQCLNTKALPNILIVDDSPADVLLLGRMLTARGYKTRQVPSGKLALEAARTEPADLILLDVIMPEMNGYEVCRQLKADAELKDIPVIFISVLDATLDKVKGFSVGGVDYVTKPFHFEELETRVQTHLKLRQLQIELEMQNEELRRVQAVVRGLTEAKEHQQRLEAEATERTSEERHRTILQTAINGFWLVDMKGRLLEVNEAYCRMSGYSMQELLAMRIPDLEAAESSDDTADHIQNIMERGEDRFESRHRRKDGTVYDVEVNVRYQPAESGRFVAFLQDVTERKRGEEEIKRNYEIQSAMNTLLKLSIEINNEKEFLDSALNLLLSLNWLAFESKGAVFLADESEKTLHLQVHRGFSGELLAVCSTVPFGKCLCGRAAAERTIQFADCIDGQHVTRVEGMSPHGHYCVPILSGDNVLGVINLYVREGHIRNLKETEFLMAIANVFASVIERKRAEAERKKMETQLGQLQKMEAVGQLAGGVAHDFNNMLAVINGYSEMLLMELPQSDPNYPRIQEICKAGQRSADLTRQLLAFARRQTIEPKVLDMNDTVAGMLKMLQRLIGENIKLMWNPAANLWKVRMDPSQLDQILANLLVNARDAISSAGKVIIETGTADLDEAFCAMHPDSVPGKYVMLEVSDNGCGMSKETLECIFEPFFTTKKVGEGTGLGLATVFGIVKQNNGFINVDSEPGKGTTFKIYLPRHESENAEKDEKTETPEMPTGTETVLLVEDNEAFLIFAKIQLEHLGYTVLDADSPVKAIRLAGEYKGDIHLLLTDVVMPEMSGRELKEKISSMRPGIKILFMSGYTKDIIASKGVLDEGIHFLQKPFTAEALSVKLREALS